MTPFIAGFWAHLVCGSTIAELPLSLGPGCKNRGQQSQPMVAGSEAGRTRVLWYVPLKPNLAGIFLKGDLLRCTMAKSPSFTTIWDNTFGVFSKASIEPQIQLGVWKSVFFTPMWWLGLHEQRNTVLTSYSYNIRSVECDHVG